MTLLALAAALWVGVHVGVAGTSLRGIVAHRIGENGFRGAFSVVSVVAIALLCAAYGRAPYRPLWLASTPLLWVLAAFMLLATTLFMGAVLTRNPTAIGGDGAEVRGIFLLTRHPMLWSFAIWAGVHVVGNGDLASVLFFGAFLVTALAGMPSIDAKIAARNPPFWRRLEAATSILPGGRGWPSAGIGVMPFAAGAVLWLVLFVGHPSLFGVSPVR